MAETQYFEEKEIQPFGNRYCTETADLKGPLLCLALLCPVSQKSVIKLEVARDCSQSYTGAKTPGLSPSSPNFPLAFLGHRVSTMPAPEDHSLGPLGGRTGTVLDHAEHLDTRFWLENT